MTGGRQRRGRPVPAEELPDFERALYHVIHASHRTQVGVPFDRQGLDDLDVGVTEFLAPLRLPASTAEFFTAIAGFASGAEPAVVSAIQLLEWIAAFGNSAYLLLPRHGTSLSTTPRA